jgi:hypothetical protein
VEVATVKVVPGKAGIVKVITVEVVVIKKRFID